MRSVSTAVLLAVTLAAPVPGAATNETPDGHADPDHSHTDDQAEPPATDQIDLRDVVAWVFGRPQSAPAAEADDDALAETRFFVFPTFGGNPAVGFAVGVLGNMTNYWGDPAETRLSSMVISASVTTKKQLLLASRSDFYSPRDRWHLAGDWRFYRFKERTHGLGSDTSASRAADIDYDWFRMHQVGYRGLWGDLEIGAGYHFDAHKRVRLSDEQPDVTRLDPLPRLADSTVSSGMSVNLVYDSRDNPLNPEGGFYGRASYTYYLEALGSDEDWEDLQLEARGFRRLPASRRQVVAAWALSRLTGAGEPPYLDFKQSEHRGGQQDHLVVHWPNGIDAKGEVRSQYHHISDIAPTIMETAGVDVPEQYHGVEQQPMDGVSMMYSFNDADAPTRKERQYYEMFGNRAIWVDGWKAVTLHANRMPWDVNVVLQFDNDEWELYHVAEDFSESTNLAEENPEKLAELIAIFDEEAWKYNVYPL